MTHPIRPFIPVLFLPVQHLKSAIEWYCGLLDMPLQAKHDGGGIYYFGLQGTDLILDSNMWGFPPMIMFDSPDIDAAYEFCRGQQYPFMNEIQRFPDVAFFSVGSNMVCQANRNTVANTPHPLLPCLSRVVAHTGQAGISAEWYETFLQQQRQSDALAPGLEQIRMEQGADLLFDDGRLSGSAPVRFDRLQLDLRFSPALLIESPDVEAALAYVRTKGAAITSGGIEFRLGLACFTFADPDGNGIMVYQK